MKPEAYFTGPLDVRWTDKKRRGRRVWELLDTIGFHCHIDGRRKTVIVRRGFATDFASVPPVVRKLIPPVGPYAKATVIHDYLYRFMIGDRKTADRIFLEAMKVCGVRWYTRSIMYRACRLFGHGGWGK